MAMRLPARARGRPPSRASRAGDVARPRARPRGRERCRAAGGGGGGAGAAGRRRRPAGRRSRAASATRSAVGDRRRDRRRRAGRVSARRRIPAAVVAMRAQASTRGFRRGKRPARRAFGACLPSAACYLSGSSSRSSRRSLTRIRGRPRPRRDAAPPGAHAPTHREVRHEVSPCGWCSSLRWRSAPERSPPAARAARAARTRSSSASTAR